MTAQIQNQPKPIGGAIALYHPTFAAKGGIERMLDRLAGIFRGMGLEVVVVTDNEERPFSIEGGTRLDYLEKTPCRAQNWRDLISRHNISCVYFGQHFDRRMPSDIKAVRETGAKALIHMHGSFASFLAFGNAEAFFDQLKAFRRADAIVVMSRADQAFYSLLGKDAVYIPNKACFGAPGGTQSRTSTKNRSILWSGRFSPGKRPLEALRIFARLKKRMPGATLTVIGQDSDQYHGMKEQFLGEMKRLGLEDSVQIHGFAPDPRKFYERADLFLSTSKIEGFSLAILEALSYGLPVVAYDLPYLEPLRNGASFTVEQLDANGAAQKIADLLEDGALYREASLAAIGAAREFAIFDDVRAWREVLSSLESPSPPREKDYGQVAVEFLLANFKRICLEKHAPPKKKWGFRAFSAFEAVLSKFLKVL